jgi:hypothetical protein
MEEGISDSLAQGRKGTIAQSGRRLFENITIKRRHSPPDLKPVPELGILPTQVLHPYLPMHERCCSEKNFLFHLLKALVVGRDCEYGCKCLMEKLLDEVEQRESHGIVT